MNTRNKVLLTAAVVGVIGVLIAVGSSALFTATTQSNNNIASTGALAASASGVTFNSTAPGQDKLKPIGTLLDARTQNVVVNGTVAITNTGNLTGDFSLTQSSVSGQTPDLPNPGPGLENTLNLCVSDVTANPANNDCGVYNGDFVMGAASAPFGTIAPSESRTLKFEVWMLEAKNGILTNSDYQNKEAYADFEFTAV